MQRSSKEYSWAYLKASNVVATREAELVTVYVVPSAAASVVTLYNGQSTGGDVIAIMEEATMSNGIFNPTKPVYCRKGIYITIEANVTGVFVQWRNMAPED
jgi:hypothetical protein